MENPAVSSVAIHGASVRDRQPRNSGTSPSSASCESVRAAPASGCKVPWNMLNIMNQMAADLARFPSTGANVGPSTSIRSFPSASGPSTPSQTTGRMTKYTEAISPLAKTARLTFFSGSRVSPT